MKIYTKLDNYQRSDRGQLMDILKPFVGKENQTLEWLKETYGDFVDEIELCDRIQDADLAVLPYTWNYYEYSGKQAQAIQFCEIAHQNHLPVISSTGGDYGFTPHDAEAWVVRPSGYKSKQRKKQIANPVFIRDPLNEYYNKELSLIDMDAKPLVGFCGQSHNSIKKNSVDLLHTAHRNLKYTLKQSRQEPQWLYPTSYFRHRVLSLLEKSQLVETNFVKRLQYRAGASNEEQRRQTAIDFYNNMRNTAYTVCIRGVGNFSVRLYETLAMGRIPLFVNTDCVLPFDKEINWKNHVVWVEYKDLRHIGELLADFHNELHPDDFKQMQLNNRRLWENYLTFGSFHKKLLEVVMKG